MSTPVPASDPVARPVPSVKALLGLAWPLVISRGAQVVVGLFDALMVAGLGEASLAATSTGALDAYAFVILPMGTVFIVSSFAAQFAGKGDPAGARRYGFYGLFFALIAQLFVLAALPFVDNGLSLFSYEPEVRRLLGTYLQYRLISVGAIVGVEALGNYYGGLGNTRLPMLASLITMTIDIGLNFLLIRGNLGAPAMGVAGAAIGSSIATFAAFLFLLGRFLLDGRGLAPVVRTLKRAEFFRMLRFGLPSGLNWFSEFLAFIVFVNIVLAGLGTVPLAGMMAVMEINSMSFMPAFGIASAGAILVGQAIGAGAKDEVPRIVRLTFVTAAIWQGIVGLAYLVFPEIIFAPFLSGAVNREALREVGVRVLMLSSAWQLFDATTNTIAESLRAAGDTAFTMWARLIIGWVVFTPGAYFSVRWLGWGVEGATLWLVLWLALLALTLFIRFRSGAWRRIQLVDPTL